MTAVRHFPTTEIEGRAHVESSWSQKTRARDLDGLNGILCQFEQCRDTSDSLDDRRVDPPFADELPWSSTGFALFPQMKVFTQAKQPRWSALS